MFTATRSREQPNTNARPSAYQRAAAYHRLACLLSEGADYEPERENRLSVLNAVGDLLNVSSRLEREARR